MKKVLLSLVVLAFATSVMASPMVNVWMETTSGATLVDNVKAGDIVNFVIKAQVAPIGTENANVTGTAHDIIHSLTALDGVTSVRVNVFQNVADPIQVSFTSLARTQYFDGAASQDGLVDPRGNGYNNIEAFRAVLDVQGGGVYSLEPVVLGTGSFQVMVAPTAETTTLLQMSFLGSSLFGGDAAVGNFATQSAGAFKIDNGFAVIAGTTNYTTNGGNLFGYQGLTLHVPEPISIVMLALGGLGLLRRKS